MRRRTKNLDLHLSLPRDQFVGTPNPEQRDWLISRSVDELVQQLEHLDDLARGVTLGPTRHAIAGEWSESTALYAGGELLIEGQQVMQDWEAPMMQAMARRVSRKGADVLEVGFGLGLSAAAIQAADPRSHTIIEFNEQVADHADQWLVEHYPGRDIEVLRGHWQERAAECGDFDGIFWDAFPTSEVEFEEYVLRDSAVAEAFFATAAAHLRPGGSFTYYTNEIDSLSRNHQRALLRYFDSFTVEVIKDLVPPQDCEYWWFDRMAIVTARSHG